MRYQSESELRKGLEEFEELVQQLCGPLAAENQGYEEQVAFAQEILRGAEFRWRMRSLLGSADDLGLKQPFTGKLCTIAFVGYQAGYNYVNWEPSTSVLTFELTGSSHSFEVKLPVGTDKFVPPDAKRRKLLSLDDLGFAKPAVDGFEVIKATEFLNLSKTVRKQDLNRDLLVSADKVKAILFISHVWEKDSHPDETNRQLEGVQAFLRNIETVVERSAQCNWGVQGLELRHGQFQAAVVSGRGHDGGSEWTGLRSLDDVGIWYDFMCLPQGERDDAEKALFQKSLAGMANFIAHESVHVVALRFEDEKDKTYENRGWCRAECACRVGQPIVYSPERDGQIEPVYIQKMLAAIRGTQGFGALVQLAAHYDSVRSRKDCAEEDCDGKEPTSDRVRLMARCAKNRLRRPSIELQHDIDLAAWIPGLLAEFGFHVTNSKDAALVGLMLLYWENYGEIDSRQLFAQAIHRVANNEKVVVEYVKTPSGLVIPWVLKID